MATQDLIKEVEELHVQLLEQRLHAVEKSTEEINAKLWTGMRMLLFLSLSCTGWLVTVAYNQLRGK